MDIGHCSGQWTVDSGQWTVDGGHSRKVCRSSQCCLVFVVCVTDCLARTDGPQSACLECEVRSEVKEGGFLASR